MLEIKAVVVVGLFEDSFTYKKDSMPFHLVALYIVKRKGLITPSSVPEFSYCVLLIIAYFIRRVLM